MLAWNPNSGENMPYIGTLDSTRPFRFESNASLRGVVTVRWLKPGGTGPWNGTYG